MAILAEQKCPRCLDDHPIIRCPYVKAVEFEFSGVAEEVVEDVAEAGGFALDHGEAAAKTVVHAVVRVEVFLEELEIEADGGEGVFNFVGEDAGECAEFSEAAGLLGEGFGVVGAVGLVAEAAAGRRECGDGDGEAGGQGREQSWDEKTHSERRIGGVGLG